MDHLHAANELTPEMHRASRAIRRAVGGASILAIISFIFGLVAAGPLTFALLIGRTKFGPGHIIYFLLCAVSFVAPAVLYALASLNLVRRRTWAAIAGIVVATIHAVAAIVVLMLLAYFAHVDKSVGWFVVVPVSAAIILLSGAVWTAISFWHALQSLHVLEDPRLAGFSPILSHTDWQSTNIQ